MALRCGLCMGNRDFRSSTRVVILVHRLKFSAFTLHIPPLMNEAGLLEMGYALFLSLSPLGCLGIAVVPLVVEPHSTDSAVLAGGCSALHDIDMPGVAEFAAGIRLTRRRSSHLDPYIKQRVLSTAFSLLVPSLFLSFTVMSRGTW